MAELPAREPHAQGRARAREAEPETAGGTLSAAGYAWVARTLPAMISGSSLWTSQPPSLATYWAGHAASARYYEAGLFRWPRYAWGVVHIVILVPIYLLGWVTHSFPLLFLTAAAVAVGFWLL